MSTCRICSQALIIELDPDSFDEATSSTVGEAIAAPDDLLLACGCHFHWQCLLDESPQIALSLACPACEDSIVLTRPGPSSSYHSEGGIENLDILPLIMEEAYLDRNPAARPARAFMTMCGEGAIGGIVELLNAIQEDPDEGDMSTSELLRFQDPLDGGKTGLHVAVEQGQQEATWLLLWLASSLPTQAFPGEVQQVAEQMGAGRETAQGPDIRSLRDEQHQRAEDIAGSMGNIWAELVGTGILKE